VFHTLDPTLILASILLVVTVGATVEFYRLLNRARKEYEKAKTTVEDVVLSFNRDLKREAERLEIVAYKVEGIASKSEGASDKAAEVEKTVQELKAKTISILADKDEILAALEETNRKLCDVNASQEAVTSKITSLEQQTKQIPALPEMNVEAVIPIKRDKALAPLTQTELSALEFLASEGPKTAPEIKWRIRLSREHTARLMKKLYESGYLERDTNKTPFKYSIKKEMETLLKKATTENA
jgi:DNA repair exonuclease SbcCD ATPase subunit